MQDAKKQEKTDRLQEKEEKENQLIMKHLWSAKVI